VSARDVVRRLTPGARSTGRRRLVRRDADDAAEGEADVRNIGTARRGMSAVVEAMAKDPEYAATRPDLDPALDDVDFSEPPDDDDEPVYI